MKYSTLRTIAELNAQPLVRMSSMGVLSYMSIAATILLMSTDMTFLTMAALLTAAYSCNRHVEWCDSRHKAA